MPSTSKKQHNFMAAVAKNPKFAKKAGVPQSVGEEFLKADKGRKFRGGGMAKVSEYGGKEMYKSKAAMRRHEKAESPAQERMEKRMKSGGKVRGDGIARKGKTKGRMC